MWGGLTEMMAHHAEKYADAPYVRFLESGEVTAVYTYGQTWQYMARWARLLRDRGLERDGAVILALPNTCDFVGAYYGTLMAGGIPAPVIPLRDPRAGDRYLEVIARRLRFLNARLLVLPASQAHAADLLPLSEMDNLAVLTERDLPDDTGPVELQGRPGGLGLYQFTSGTASEPKVVELTQEALLAQTRMISKALRLEPGIDSAVSWLPLFHDMGLIGYLLTPAWVHGCVNLMLPEDFILRPSLWIKALSDHGATITGGPPSGYNLLARRTRDEDVAGYRLDQVRIALVGAEMVTPESLERFLRRVEPIGFRRSSLMPTYGMAENGLAISMPPLGCGPEFDSIDLARLANEGRALPPQSPDAPQRAFASVGQPLEGIRVVIAGQAGERLEERRVGEIVIRSPSLMRGYYRQPEATRQVLRDGWLHTGDLGYLSGGQLYITGRQKEVLIVGGRNYYPDDLEEVAGAVPGVRKGRVVAVSYADAERSTEAVVILAETAVSDRAQRGDLRRRIREALAQVGYPVSRVVLLRRKTIRLTPNGKLRRLDCRDRYLAGEFGNEDQTN